MIRDDKIKWLDFGTTPDPENLQPILALSRSNQGTPPSQPSRLGQHRGPLLLWGGGEQSSGPKAAPSSAHAQHTPPPPPPVARECLRSADEASRADPCRMRWPTESVLPGQTKGCACKW